METTARGPAVVSNSASFAPDLSNVPGFTPEDVAANLTGRLSGTQVVMVRSHALNRTVSVAALVGVSIFFWTRGTDFLWVAILSIAIAVSLYRLALAIADLTNPSVEIVEGEVSIERDDEGHRFLRAADKRLSLSKKAQTAMSSGGPYRVFFLARAKLVVGAEVLPGWRPAPPSASKRRFPFSIEIG